MYSNVLWLICGALDHSLLDGKQQALIELTILRDLHLIFC